MIDFEELAQEKEQNFEALRDSAFEILQNSNIKEMTLKLLLKDAYRMGHYAGHCRGEKCARESLGALERDRL